MPKKILIVGSSSFVATGLYEKMIQNGLQVDCFSRGQEKRVGDKVFGDVLNLKKNKFLEKNYDVIINYILIKDGGESKNLAFIKGLVLFCETVNAKQLLHFSSIMVYPNTEVLINENTAIETNTYKNGYAANKIATDTYLESLNGLPFQISFIRPSYVLSADRAAPFIKKLPFGFILLKGHKKAIMPIVKRESIHKAVIAIIALESKQPVYLFLPNSNTTKYAYAKGIGYKRVITLPKWLVLGTAKLCLKVGVLPASFYVRIESKFIESKYDSSITENELQLTF
ncbi:NAD-dependent epimerase/dehydratase family protein [Maribacter sp. TH_r10]|uniref:NAD-dependent epimerase/dehydratase family protein n=1 Tax=Maribacter sp. TH_r10 TaxID=3082086 RepID=UPI0029542300|nr:NAD-dependent epimerase/dehydratase family protein [Maribacter sp. TH_r10]MDV7140211.1 NAD-dependent epimerase/dehydratase family protein [Maribacter sp. TH_r10]